MLSHKYEIRAHRFLSFIVLLIALLFKLFNPLTIFDTLAYITNTHIKVSFFSGGLLIQIFSQLIKVKLMQLFELLFELIKFLPTSSTSSIWKRFLLYILGLFLWLRLLFSFWYFIILRALNNILVHPLLLLFYLLQYFFILFLTLSIPFFFLSLFLFLVIPSFLLFDILNQSLLLLPREWLPLA